MNRLPAIAAHARRPQSVGGASCSPPNSSTASTPVRSASRSVAYRRIFAALQRRPYQNEAAHLAADQTNPWLVIPNSDRCIRSADDGALVRQGIPRRKILLLSDLGRGTKPVAGSRTNQFAPDIVVAGLPTQTEPLCVKPCWMPSRPRVIIMADSGIPRHRPRASDSKARLTRWNDWSCTPVKPGACGPFPSPW